MTDFRHVSTRLPGFQPAQDIADPAGWLARYAESTRPAGHVKEAIDPRLFALMAGGTLGGLGGLVADRFRDEDDRDPWSAGLGGALAGAALGGGYGLMKNPPGLEDLMAAWDTTKSHAGDAWNKAKSGLGIADAAAADEQKKPEDNQKSRTDATRAAADAAAKQIGIGGLTAGIDQQEHNTHNSMSRLSALGETFADPQRLAGTAGLGGVGGAIGLGVGNTVNRNLLDPLFVSRGARKVHEQALDQLKAKVPDKKPIRADQTATQLAQFLRTGHIGGAKPSDDGKSKSKSPGGVLQPATDANLMQSPLARAWHVDRAIGRNKIFGEQSNRGLAGPAQGSLAANTASRSHQHQTPRSLLFPSGATSMPINNLRATQNSWNQLRRAGGGGLWADAASLGLGALAGATVAPAIGNWPASSRLLEAHQNSKQPVITTAKP